ncbi:hypothetical protein [Intrasporangium sp.]|uniref:hypothetical protein n=1 Tax=Intrasporangium sp. TaxID=1925024 RepID=UPI00293B5C69|nr:hypothetical protein [Intrasporangium sp.]MDV3221589.1 hypothetical protein [Intrasporangium sp.]
MRCADPVAAALAGMIASTVVGACSAPAATDGPFVAAQSVAGVRPATASPLVRAEAWREVRSTLGTEMMRVRAAAVEPADERAWLARVGERIRPEQQQILSRMGSIGVERVRLRAIEETVPPAAAVPGSSVSWEARATLDYRIAGFDESPRAFTLDVTFTADPARPRATAVITGSRPGERPEPWDLAGLQVRRTEDALVLAAGDAADVAEVADRAAAAARQVSGVLGSAAVAVWVVPASDAEAARLLGRDEGGLRGVAAATDGPIGPGSPAGADRIVLVPSAWSALSAVGRDVVLTHELTHVTTRRTSMRLPPLWLSEGLAEFIAYRDVDLPETEVVRSALGRVRSAGLPADLPTARDFDSVGGDLEVAYGQSLLVARTIADRHGTAALVGLFRAVNDGSALPGRVGEDADAATDHFLERRLGTDRHTIVEAWRSRLAVLASTNR